MQNYKLWLSIASSTGLSVVSLGTPGLKEDLDEQVFTGGISAVTHLLTTEIGSSERSFIGGGDTRKMGRFIVSNNSKEVVTQFLLMTIDNSKVQEIHLTYIKEIAINFATMMISSPIWEDVEKGFKTLTSTEVLETFIDSIIITRKKLNQKIQMNDELFSNRVKSFINHSFKSPEYFETLVKITDMEPTLEDVDKEIKPISNIIIEELGEEILSIILDEDPIPVLFKSKLKNINNEIKLLYKTYIDENIEGITKNELINTMNDIFSGDIAEILQNFNVVEMRELRPKIHIALANDIVIRLSKKNPLLLIVNPTLKSSTSFKEYIDENVEAIYQEYDLASILGKITSLLLEDEDPISIFLISEFIRIFAMHFPAGLSNHGWKFIHTSFKMFSRMKDTNIKKALDDLDISGSHLATINSFLKGIKPSNDLKSMRFTVSKEGEEIIKFYNVLQQAIVEGTQNFFNEIVWTPKQLGIFSQTYTEKIEKVVSKTQYLTSVISVIKYICTNTTLEYISTLGYLPTIDDLKNLAPAEDIKDFDFDNLTSKQRIYFWKPKFIVKSYENHTLTLLDNEITKFTTFTKDITKNIENNIKLLENELKQKEKGKKIKTKIKSLDKINLTTFNILDNYSLDIWDSYNEIITLKHNFLENSFDTKKSENFLFDLQKISDRLNKKIVDHNKRAKDFDQKFRKGIVKETQKLHRESQKIFMNSVIPEYQIKENKNREEFIIPDPKSICGLITSSIENNQIIDSNFPKNSELISTFASIVIFNDLPRNIFNDVLNTAILTGSKGSPIINEMIAEMKLKSSPSVDYLYIENHLKKHIKNHTEKRFVSIFESILTRINQSYFNQSKGVVRSYPINSNDFGEMSCIDIGELNIPWIIDLTKTKGTDLFGENVHFIELDDKTHVFYEIERFPSSGQRYPITKAIMQGTWNEIIGNQAGLYIEILKMSCELIGESRRKKFQEFLEKLFQIID